MEKMDYQIVFSWPKSSGGYVWVDYEAGGGYMSSLEDLLYIPIPPYLIEKDCSQGIEMYKPFEDLTLFAKFADIEATPKSFKAWADRYGLLTDGEGLPIYLEEKLYVPLKEAFVLGEEPSASPRTAPGGEEGAHALAESLSFWLHEHRDLSFAVMVWELAANKDVGRLRKIIRWFDRDTKIEICHVKKASLDKLDIDRLSDDNYRKEHIFGENVLFDRNTHPGSLKHMFRYPDVIRPALFYVQKIINRKAREHPLHVVLQFDEFDDQGKLRKQFQPTSMLSIMWYQFYLVVAGDEALRRCAVCGQWENMRDHRDSWKKHKTCASHERVKRFRKK